jgi:Rrf2 family protein
VKIFSDACEYGLRAAVWLALQPRQSYKVRDIANEIQAPPGYLVKVLQRLAKAGILSAQRGSQGGFALERDPANLQVLEIINAVDPIERIRVCPLKLKSHSKALCPLHQQLDDAMGLIEKAFGAVTVADLIDTRDASINHCRALGLPTAKDIQSSQ